MDLNTLSIHFDLIKQLNSVLKCLRIENVLKIDTKIAYQTEALPGGNFMVKSQRCSNVIFTTSFLQRCYNIISQCCVHVVAQRCDLRCSNVAGMLFSQRCKITTLYNVVCLLGYVNFE